MFFWLRFGLQASSKRVIVITVIIVSIIIIFKYVFIIITIASIDIIIVIIINIIIAYLDGRLSPDRNLTADYSDNSSNVSSITHSPTNESRRNIRKDLKKKYEKDELWRAIKSDYHYLMDEDIIEQCRVSGCGCVWEEWVSSHPQTFHVSF